MLPRHDHVHLVEVWQLHVIHGEDEVGALSGPPRVGGGDHGRREPVDLARAVSRPGNELQACAGEGVEEEGAREFGGGEVPLERGDQPGALALARGDEDDLLHQEGSGSRGAPNSRCA